MSTNKLFINILIIGLFLIIGLPSIYKVAWRHQIAQYTVMEKMVIEKAEDCYYKKECKNAKITLKELYEKKYLKEKLVDPKSKEEYSDESYVMVSKKESTFHLQ